MKETVWRGSRRSEGSSFLRQGAAYWKQRLVILRVDRVGGHVGRYECNVKKKHFPRFPVLRIPTFPHFQFWSSVFPFSRFPPLHGAPLHSLIYSCLFRILYIKNYYTRLIFNCDNCKKHGLWHSVKDIIKQQRSLCYVTRCCVFCTLLISITSVQKGHSTLRHSKVISAVYITMMTFTNYLWCFVERKIQYWPRYTNCWFLFKMPATPFWIPRNATSSDHLRLCMAHSCQRTKFGANRLRISRDSPFVYFPRWRPPPSSIYKKCYNERFVTLVFPVFISTPNLMQICQELAKNLSRIGLLCIIQVGDRRRHLDFPKSAILDSRRHVYCLYTLCPRKKEASSFSTISLAFLDRFS